MKVDWDNIKYIFQLPLKWYSWIDTKIRHMYGADFINIKHNGYNDGIEVGVDYDSFANEVRKIAGQPEDGWVKSVDNNYPDEFGDVRTNSIKGIDSGSQTYYPDARGIVSVPFSSTVQSVDNVGPDTGGNIQLGAVRSVNGEYFPDESGNIFLPFDGTVKSVDNVPPDSSGNVRLGALTTLDIADQGSTAGPSYKGDKPVSPMSHNHNIDEVLGVKNEDGTYNFVKSINTKLKPDSNGNINLNLPDVPAGQFLVGSVDGIAPNDEKGDVKLGAVRSIKVGDTAQDILKPDENGQIDLGKIDGSVKTVNYVEPDDDGNIDLGNLVYTVNDIEPDASGNIAVTTDNLPGMTNYPTITQVNTNITNQINPISDKLENLTHTDITDWNSATAAFLDTLDVETAGMTVGLDYVSERFVCNVNHGHKLDDITDWDDNIKEKLDDYFVTLDTDQTITGKKEFKDTVGVQSLDTSTGVQLHTTGLINIKGDTPAIAFYDKNDSHSDAYITLDVGEQRLEFNSQNNDMLIGTNSTDMHVNLIAPQNNAVVNNPPSDDCPVNNAIATVGWVRKNAGGVKSVDTDYKPDDNGNIDLKAVRTEDTQTINGAKTFTNQVYVKNSNGTATYYPHAIYLNRASGGPFINFYPDGGGVAGTIQSTSTNGLYLSVQAGKNLLLNAEAGKAILSNHPSADTTTTSKSIPTVGWCNTYFGRVKSVNGKTPDANGNVVVETGDGSVKAVDNVSPDATGNVSLGAVRTIDVETRGVEVNKASTYQRYACPTAHGHRSQDISINGFTNLYDWLSGPFAWGNNQIYADYLINNVGVEKNLTVDGHATTLDANKNSVVSFGLAANKWLKSDANGHITYTNDTPIALPSGTTGKSQTVTVVTGLSWNGTQLVATRSNLTFTNGALTNVASASNTTINTVAYS